MAEVRTFLICLLARPFSVVDRISLNHAVTNWLIVDSADILVTSDRKPLAIMSTKKSLSATAKQQLVLDHIRKTRTCHTLRDLEKMLPSVASINGMQVKEYVQTLVDDNKIRVEKIGSMNWYWSFSSDERRRHENAMEKLFKDVERARRTVQELESEVEQKTAALQPNGAMDDESREKERAERKALMTRKQSLSEEVKKLKEQEDVQHASGVAGIETKKHEIQVYKEMAAMWTDNIYILEQYLMKLADGDRDLVDKIKRECYGEEYVEGEGLRELEF